MDLSIMIPRSFVELLNFDFVANILATNNVGFHMKLDSRFSLRDKIRFARACIS